MDEQRTTPPPRWAVRAAHAVPLLTLPSGLWRLALVAGVPLGLLDAHGAPMDVHGWESVSIACLSVVSEAAALLTLVLVRPWGERVPARVPGIGGRTIPAPAVVVPAAAMTVVLALIWGFAFRHFPDFGELGFTAVGWRLLLIACYLPALLWAPIVGVLTFAYRRRRSAAALQSSPAPLSSVPAT